MDLIENPDLHLKPKPTKVVKHVIEKVDDGLEKEMLKVMNRMQK
jgi:hypothetical protein